MLERPDELLKSDALKGRADVGLVKVPAKADSLSVFHPATSRAGAAVAQPEKVHDRVLAQVRDESAVKLFHRLVRSADEPLVAAHLGPVRPVRGTPQAVCEIVKVQGSLLS